MGLFIFFCFEKKKWKGNVLAQFPSNQAFLGQNEKFITLQKTIVFLLKNLKISKNINLFSFFRMINGLIWFKN